MQAQNRANQPAGPGGERDDVTTRIAQTLQALGPALPRPGQLMQLLTADPRDPQAVITALHGDPVLSARVLAAVNAAAMGVAKQICSIERAVLLLGGGRARTIAMAYGLKLLVESMPLPQPLTDLLWFNGVRKAIAARRFCELVDPEHSDTAYSLGLLQDLGLPMLMSADTAFYESDAMVSGTTPWCDLERQHFGINHSAVGQGLLLEWQASDTLQRAVLNHHNPPDHHAGDDEAIRDLALFFAGLMPHLEEGWDGGQREWIQAIHARFLGDIFPTPDHFFEDVTRETRRMIGDRSEPSIGSGPDKQRFARALIGEIAADTARFVSHLCYLDSSMSQTQANFRDLRAQAFTDPLTRTLNRRGFEQLAERRLELATRNKSGVCCMLLDMDGFKQVNDTYGHEAGDRLLRGVGKILRMTLDRRDLISRLGGDEFAIFLMDVEEEQARAIGKRVLKVGKRHPIRISESQAVPVCFSLGAAYLSPVPEGTKLEELLRAADASMYQIKRAGKGGMILTVVEPEFPEA